MKKGTCRRFGASVVEKGDIYDEAYEEARRISAEEEKFYVHPVADTDVVAGQGTIALEILDRMPETEQIVVPLGGGGLVSGIAFAAKHLKPSLRIVAVQAEGSPLFHRCLTEGRLVSLDSVDTIADGMACKTAEPYLFEMIRRYVDEVVVVPETVIRRAMRTAAAYAKLVLEGSGAVALGAVMNGQVDSGLATVVIASGGNIDPAKFLAVLAEEDKS